MNTGKTLFDQIMDFLPWKVHPLGCHHPRVPDHKAMNLKTAVDRAFAAESLAQQGFQSICLNYSAIGFNSL